MSDDYRLSRNTVFTALLAAALAAPALAQDEVDPFGPKVMEEVIVTAPRILHRDVIDRTIGGGKVEQITLTRRVSYEDLDLRLAADVDELERRVGEMAREACKTIAEVYPLIDAEPSESECVRRAIAGAMTQVHAAAAAAGQ